MSRKICGAKIFHNQKRVSLSDYLQRHILYLSVYAVPSTRAVADFITDVLRATRRNEKLEKIRPRSGLKKKSLFTFYDTSYIGLDESPCDINKKQQSVE